MAILRRLLLRHRTTAFSLLRNLSLSSFSVTGDSISSTPSIILYSPPCQWNPGRRFSSESPPVTPEIDSEKLSSEVESEEYLPRGLDVEDIEGCDFNHWLIVINFPKNPRPSSEEMIRFYEETCAKTLNLSLEEAKKKIYATSTSNYTGFHVQVSEMESEKFHEQSGVVFVLPDSYIDKENKEYGGDRYINGVIIPRPRVSRRRIWDAAVPPRQQGGRSNSREQTTTPSSGQDLQRSSPPYTHEGVTGRAANEAPPSHLPPQPPSEQRYYTPPPPDYPPQHNGYAPPGRNPYQQGNSGFAPNLWSHGQGAMWNYAPPPPPHFDGLHHSQQVEPYSWNVDQGYPGPTGGSYHGAPAHGPPQPNWPGQPYPGQPYSDQPSQGQPYPGQPYSDQPSQGQVYPGQPYSDQPSQGQVYSGQPYSDQPSQSQVYSGQPYPGQPSQGQVFQGQPSQRQGHRPNEDYQEHYGSQYEQQQPDNSYQGEGPSMRYWR